jgi:hypothetical protein
MEMVPFIKPSLDLAFNKIIYGLLFNGFDVPP